MKLDQYEQMSVAQRICHLALANFSPSFRRRLLSSNLVADLVKLGGVVIFRNVGGFVS
jgi:hypothetical protein